MEICRILQQSVKNKLYTEMCGNQIWFELAFQLDLNYIEM